MAEPNHDTMGASDSERDSPTSPQHVNKHAVVHRPRTPHPSHSYVTPGHQSQGAGSKLFEDSRMSVQPPHDLFVPKHRTSVGLPANPPPNQVPRSFEGLDERAIELLRGFNGYNEVYGDKNGKQTAQDQMHAILKQAYENVLPYGAKTPVLADALHQNISDAQGLWFKAESKPHDVLDTYIFCETKLVQEWNINRLGGRAPLDDAANVPDKDPSFPLRWASIKHGVKVRTQRPTTVQLAFQAPNTRVQTRSVSERMPSVTPKPTIEAEVIRSSSAQLKATAPKVPLVMPAIGPGVVAAAQKGKKKGPNTVPYDLLSSAPSANVPFPAQGTRANVTAIELLVFFPRYLKSTDIIDRLISNKFTPAMMAYIVNDHRVVRGNNTTKANSYNVWMRAQMRKRGPAYLAWTTTIHQIPAGHDPTNLNIAGLKTEEDVRSPDGPTPRLKDANPGSILFRDLGDYVKNFPSGLDALDLTRCVKYAMDNPNQSWEYPNDFEDLVAHIGGPAPVQKGHHDSAAFLRWQEHAKRDKYKHERLYTSGLGRGGIINYEQGRQGGQLRDVSPSEKEADDQAKEHSPQDSEEDDRREQLRGSFPAQQQEADHGAQLHQVVVQVKQEEVEEDSESEDDFPIKQYYRRLEA